MLTSIMYLQQCNKMNMKMQSLVPFFRGWYKLCLCQRLESSWFKHKRRHLWTLHATAQFGTTARWHIQRLAKWRCVMMCHGSLKQEFAQLPPQEDCPSTAAFYDRIETSWQRAKILCGVWWGRLFHPFPHMGFFVRMTLDWEWLVYK